MISKKQISDITFDTLANLKASNTGIKEGIFALCVEQETIYRYITNGSSFTPNDLDILITGNGGNTRWIAVSGKYADVWREDTTSIYVKNNKDIDLQDKGLEDDTTTSPIILSDATNTEFNTDTKTITGALNEVYDTASYQNSGFINPITYTDNLDGTLTIDANEVLLYSTIDFTGQIKKYTITQDTFTIPDDSQKYYIYVDWNAGNPIYALMSGAVNPDNSRNFTALTVFREGLELHILDWDASGSGGLEKTVTRLIETERFRRVEGLVLAETGTRNFTITQGVTYNGIARQILTSFDSTIDDCYLHVKNAGSWTRQAITQFDNLNYNDDAGLVEIGNNRYTVNWVYRGEEHSKNACIILGTEDYKTIAEANASQPRLDLPDIVKGNGILIGRFIVFKNSTTAELVQSSFDKPFSPTGTIIHNDLADLLFSQSGVTYGHINDQAQTIAGNKTFSDNVVVDGNLTVNGTETIINTETLDVEDKNIELGSVLTPTDTTADGGGITLKGDTDKELKWLQSDGNWNSTESFNLPDGKEYYRNGVSAYEPFIQAKRINGFVDGTTQVNATFNNATRTFSIQPNSGEFIYYSQGEKFTKTSLETIVIPDSEGLHYIYYLDDVLSTSQTWNDDYIGKYSFISVVYWDFTNKKQIYFAREFRHGCNMNPDTHMYLHENEGMRLTTGGALTDLLVDESGNLDSHIQFGNEASSVADEDAKFSFSARLSTSIIPIYYRTGNDIDNIWRIDETRNYPLIPTGSGRAGYNELSGGVWSLTEVTNNDFLLIHVAITNDTDRPYVVFLGQGDYINRGQAREGAKDEVNNLILNGLPIVEFKFIGTIIAQTGNAKSNSAKSEFVSTDGGFDYIDLRGEVINRQGVSGTVVDHNTLANRDGINSHPTEAIQFDTTAGLTVVEVGGISAGTDLNTLSVYDIFDQMFYPELFPTLINPSISFSLSQSGLREIGEVVASLDFTSTFNRGQITPAYTTSGFRSGLPNTYNYTGSGLPVTNASTLLTDSQSVTSYTVLSGSQSWTSSVSYDEGEQPLSSKGNNYDSPLSAGTTSTDSVSIVGVYPVFATTSAIDTLTKQSLVNTNSTLIYDFIAEDGTNKQAFEVADTWDSITQIEQFNTLSGSYDVISLASFTSSVSSQTIQGNVVAYTRYEHNGSTIGARRLRITF